MHLYFIFKSFIFRGLETFHAFIFLLKYYRTCGFTWLNFCNLNKVLHEYKVLSLIMLNGKYFWPRQCKSISV